MANFNLNLNLNPSLSDPDKKTSDPDKKIIEDTLLLHFKLFLDQRMEIKNSAQALPRLLKPIGIPKSSPLNQLFGGAEQFDLSKITTANYSSSKYAIALLDTGVFEKHPYFIANSIKLLSSNQDATDHDQHGHGTHIAGIMSAAGEMKGVAPGAPIVSYKVTNDDQSYTSWVNIANALQYIVDGKGDGRKISVVNLSFNAFNNLRSDKREEIYSHRIKGLINELYKKKIPLVVSGGNFHDAFVKPGGKDSFGLAFPANHRKVIACGASCISGELRGHQMSESDLAPFTQRPNGYSLCDAISKKLFIVTPAIATQSTNNSLVDLRSILMGSSMAAPVITGVIFILQQLYLGLHHKLPDISYIKKQLRKMCGDRVANSGQSRFSERIKKGTAFFNSKKRYFHLAETKATQHLIHLSQSHH